jgi:hypothetical protein
MEWIVWRKEFKFIGRSAAVAFCSVAQHIFLFFSREANQIDSQKYGRAL